MAVLHRRLPEPMTAYRIGDPRGAYPIYSADGARRIDGRWHRKGQAVIYASEHYSTAMLEKLVHYSGALPKGQHFITVTIPAGTTYESVSVHSLPGWERSDGAVARTFGAAWLGEARSAILLVPSVVARMERNILINLAHPDAAAIRSTLEEPVPWDERLFAKVPG